MDPGTQAGVSVMGLVITGVIWEKNSTSPCAGWPLRHGALLLNITVTNERCKEEKKTIKTWNRFMLVI